MDMEYEEENLLIYFLPKKSKNIYGPFVAKLFPPQLGGVILLSPYRIHSKSIGGFFRVVPATGLRNAVAPELEIYPNGDINGEDYQCEVLDTIVKK